MSPEAQNLAEKPALLATFHVSKKGKKVADRIQEMLRDGLDLEQDGRGRWRTPDSEEALMFRFDLWTAPADATFLQVAINAEGDIARAWEESRQTLEKCLKPEDLENPEAPPERIWGYTLHYHATLNPGYDPEEVFDKLRPAARLLHSGEGPYASLAQAEMTEGWMWLLAVPTEGKGPAAGTVYIALDRPEQERGFGEALLGKGAELLMTELIAHKSYYQRRQYRGGNYEVYKRDLDEFRKLIGELLNELEDREVPNEELRELTERYHALAGKVWELEDLRVSMARQLHNYDEWGTTGDNDVFRYHRHRIETASAELELLVSEGRYALGVADPVISMSRYRAEKAEERNQQRRQILLALVAAVLALSQLIDKDVARWVLINWTPLLGPSENNTGVEFGAQILLVGFFAILFWLVMNYFLNGQRSFVVRLWLGVRRWRNRRRKSQFSEGE